MTKEELKRVLKELHQQGDAARARAEAAEFLKSVDAKTLSLAEQELLEEGITEEELRRLCPVHLEFLGEELEQQRAQPEATHPVAILMEEHQIILRNLEELQRIVAEVQRAKGLAELGEQIACLKAIAHLLLDTESHHKREEETLFPRLEREGVTGPPRIMRLEHEELRAGKARLAELVAGADSISYAEFAKELADVGGYLADNLQAHIYKEDNILYPTALNTLQAEEWEAVLQEFDGIGYCCFTPVRA